MKQIMDRPKEIIDTAADKLGAKLDQLAQLVQQLINSESAIGEPLKQDCQELKLHVDEIESKQRKFQDYLKNFL